MIDYSKYDINKVKPEDMIYFIQGEYMNQIEWQHRRPWWQKLIHPFYPTPMPKRYTVETSIGRVKRT